jgi:hypothetical protein
MTACDVPGCSLPAEEVRLWEKSADGAPVAVSRSTYLCAAHARLVLTATSIGANEMLMMRVPTALRLARQIFEACQREVEEAPERDAGSGAS